MKILAISDHHRHELANAASLKLQKFDVEYLAIGSAPSLQLTESNKNIQVCSDKGNIKIPVSVYQKPSLIQAITKSKNLDNLLLNIDQDFDLVITTNGVPFFIGYHLSNLNNVPLVLRTWGFKASKYKIYYEYKDYFALSLTLPSMLNLSFQIQSSKRVVCLDQVVKNFINEKMPWINNKKLNIVYPSFITIKDKEKSSIGNIDKINDMNNTNPYIFGIVSINYDGVGIWNYAASKTEIKFFNILRDIAFKNPKLNVIVVGTNYNDVKKIFSGSVPTNMILLGKVYSDINLSNLYKNACLIIVPTLYGTISNRLLEAFYYKKRILTNRMTLKLFPELIKEENVIVSDEYYNYWRIVRDLTKKTSIENAIVNNSETFKKIFSINKNGVLMKKIIDSLSK